jgi:hypothetical protein
MPRNRGAVNEMTYIVIIPVRPQTCHATGLAMLFPRLGVDAAVGGERSDDNVADAAVALRMPGFARQFKTNLPELLRQETYSGSALRCMAIILASDGPSTDEANFSCALS